LTSPRSTISHATRSPRRIAKGRDGAELQ
jgi:hypothetical protein